MNLVFFRNQRFSTALLFGVIAFSCVRCGDDEPKKKPTPTDIPSPVSADPETNTDTPPPPATSDKKTPEPASPSTTAKAPAASAKTPVANAELPFTQAELMTLVGLTTTQSQSAYGHCRDILAQGVYNRYQDQVSDTVEHALTQRFCAMTDDEFIDKLQQYYHESKTDSANSSHSDAGGFQYMGVLGVDFSTAGSTSNSSSQDLTRAQASETQRRWKSSNCGDSSEAQASDYEHTVLSEHIDENVVAAWRSCVSKESNGFFCESSESDDTVSVRMYWSPNAFQAALLPKLNLSQQTAHNLELVSTKMPASVGTGSGVAVTYKRIDPAANSVFEALGSDPAHQVDFHCSIQVSKVIHGQFKEAEQCGLKELKSGRGPVCGAETYKSGTGPACGALTYNTKASSACGILNYKTGPDASCPGYLAPSTQTVVSGASRCSSDAKSPEGCPAGFADLGVRKETTECHGAARIGVDWTQVYRRTRTCQRGETVATCRLSRFGLESYKTCAHPSHGIKSYKTCVDPTFGAKTYKSCRNVAFGKTFNTCFVKD